MRHSKKNLALLGALGPRSEACRSQYRVKAIARAPGKAEFEYDDLVQADTISTAVILAESNLRIAHRSAFAQFVKVEVEVIEGDAE